jgi:hypothetical protein
LSETDTDAATTVDGDEDQSEGVAAPIGILSPPSSHVTISRIIPFERSEDTYSYTSSPRSSSPAYSLEYSDDPSASNPVDIPSELEEEILVHSFPRRFESEDRETTPKRRPVVLPPTPAESLQDWESSQGDEVPPSPWMPQIPDQEPLEEWETVNAEEEVPPTPPAKDFVLENAPNIEEENDDDSITTGSTVAPTPVPDEVTAPIADSNAPLSGATTGSTVAPAPVSDEVTAPIADNNAPLPGDMPFPDVTPLAALDFSPITFPNPDLPPPTISATIPVPNTPSPVETSEDYETPPTALDSAPLLEQDAPLLEQDVAHDHPASVPEPEALRNFVARYPELLLQDPLVPYPKSDVSHPPVTANALRTPPPSFEDLYGSEFDANVDADVEYVSDAAELAPNPPTERAASQHASRPATPPAPSPSGSLSRALGLRKEALEIRARIAALSRQRKSSLSEGGSIGTAAAILAKVEMDRAEKELVQVNEKAAGAFVGGESPRTVVHLDTDSV